jgi:hypothetical protein
LLATGLIEELQNDRGVAGRSFLDLAVELLHRPDQGAVLGKREKGIDRVPPEIGGKSYSADLNGQEAKDKS